MSKLGDIQKKIIEYDDIQSVVSRWRQNEWSIVFTNGCFDLLHLGHVDYLSKAADLGDKLVVGLNSDASVSKLKGLHRPLQNEESRKMLMAALQFVDAVIVFEEDTPIKLIEAFKPDFLVKGGDYVEATVVGADLIKANGGKVVLIPFLEGYSTTSIEQKIIAGRGIIDV